MSRLAVIIISLFMITSCSEAEFHHDNVCKAEVDDMVMINGATIKLGQHPVYPEEFSRRTVTVNGFYASRFEVTNKQFQEFVDATGYVTIAERELDPQQYPDIPPAFLVAGSAVFSVPDNISQPRDMSWWTFIPGANWRQPTGPGSSIEGKDYYPVVHVALMDAQAYANWKGHRLPTEEEHELMGLFATEQKSSQQAPPNANTWQGAFPLDNTVDDGYAGLAPVGCYDAGQNGLYDVIGNVWEWTQSPFYAKRDAEPQAFEKWPEGYDPKQPGIPVSVIKGGSYLCSDDYCMRFRPAARQAQDTGLGTSHIGFRTVKDI